MRISLPTGGSIILKDQEEMKGVQRSGPRGKRKVIRGREEKCVLRGRSGLEALGGGVFRGGGTTPTGELLNKHTLSG
jgi:hypothetical protein